MTQIAVDLDLFPILIYISGMETFAPLSLAINPRGAIEGSANEEAWTLHIAERTAGSGVAANGAGTAARSDAGRGNGGEGGLTGRGKHLTFGDKSHDAVFETALSKQLLIRALARKDASRLHTAVRKATAGSWPVGNYLKRARKSWQSRLIPSDSRADSLLLVMARLVRATYRDTMLVAVARTRAGP